MTTDRERYGPRGRVRVTGWLRDSRYEPVAGRRVRLEVVDKDGRGRGRASARTDSDGRLRAEIRAPATPGGYRVVASVEAGGERVRADEAFVVEAGGDELADPRARPDLLRRSRERTGGRYFDDPASVPDLASLDATRTRVLGTSERRPFATPWAFGALLVLFGLEWVLRRAWGKR